VWEEVFESGVVDLKIYNKSAATHKDPERKSGASPVYVVALGLATPHISGTPGGIRNFSLLIRSSRGMCPWSYLEHYLIHSLLD
jgi:hypothetical protein